MKKKIKDWRVISTGLDISPRNLERLEIIKRLAEDNPEIKEKYEKILKNKLPYTTLELFEEINEKSYKSIEKIRPLSFQNLIRFAISLKHSLFERAGSEVIQHFRGLLLGLTVKEIEDIYLNFGISERTAYDYLSTLQLLLEYTDL